MNYSLKYAEQETTVTINRAETEATIYTCDRRYMRKLDKLCESAPDAYKCVWVDSQVMGDGLPLGKKYTAPAKLIRFNKPRVMTDEQIEAAKERGKQNAELLARFRPSSRAK